MRIPATLAILLAVGLAGCTGGGDGDDGFETPEQDDQGRYVIRMTQNNRFVPEDARVPQGATVVWVNDGGSHNTQSDDGLWASEVSGDTGEHFERTFDETGDFDYHCRPHESLGMVGTIRVE